MNQIFRSITSPSCKKFNALPTSRLGWVGLKKQLVGELGELMGRKVGRIEVRIGVSGKRLGWGSHSSSPPIFVLPSSSPFAFPSFERRCHDGQIG